MADKSLLGPWPLGQDTVHDELHPVFQLSEEPGQSRLTQAVNVDLDDAGFPRKRNGFYPRFITDLGMGLYTGLYTLVQDGGRLLLVDSEWQETELVSLLSELFTIRFCELGGQVWWTNSEVCGRVKADGTASNWGLAVPPVASVSAGTGSLRAGRYQVACTFVDADGVESGAPEAAVISLDTQGLVVDLTSVSADAAWVNIYVSPPNQPELFWVAKVAPAALPVTINDVGVSTRPLRTQHLRGPIPGDGLFSYQSFLMIYRDNVIFRSVGLSPHLFDPEARLIVLPSNVIGGAGLADGFWVLTESHGAWWFTGQPGEWRNEQKDKSAYARGAFVVDGSKIDRLETTQKVALFTSEDGLVAGLPGGQLVKLTDNRLSFDVVGKECSIVLREIDGIDQILLSVW